MPSIETLFTFTIAAIILNLSPGPSNLYVMARSISQGTQGGVVAAFGLASGLMVHVILSALGVSAIFKYSPFVYSVVKIAGAIYLIYLGVLYWKTCSSDIQSIKSKRLKNNLQIYKESVLVELTNPKTALFFLAFLPQFITADAGPISTQIIVLGSIVTLTAIPCDIFVAFTSTKISSWVSARNQTKHIQERVSGSLLLAMGGFIIVEEVIE
ncbi:LysE family translocator [Desulfosediminicola flagellatus]|uniref:LysE family translocator n=1 Tax=Desulfosediminicola flagellatus TaxID=2569541 RepID=UPI0010AD4866|nr:LysE family translocator [Desulfosediminicola flagellatus]